MGPRFEEALIYANAIHAAQIRKGTKIPYIAHLLSVAALVMEHGGDEDQAIAGLLHDAVEDQGGKPRLEDIRQRFGDKVADIVDACSDTDVTPKPPWDERKKAYIAKLAHEPPEALLVSLADKVHNARAILCDYKSEGEKLWARFNNAGRDQTMWYYRELCNAFRARNNGPLSQILEDTVSELERMVRAT